MLDFSPVFSSLLFFFWGVILYLLPVKERFVAWGVKSAVAGFSEAYAYNQGRFQFDAGWGVGCFSVFTPRIHHGSWGSNMGMKWYEDV